MKRVIISILFAVFAATALQAQTIVTSDTSVEYLLPEGRVGFQAGIGYRTGKIDKSLDSFQREFVEKLRPGFCFAFDFEYYFADAVGFGIKIQDLHSSASADVKKGVYTYTTIDETIDIGYIGPLLSYRFFDPAWKNVVFMNVGAGCLLYHDEGASGYYTASQDKFAPGVSCDLGFDLHLNETLYFGLSVSMTLGAMILDQSDQNNTTVIIA